MKRLTYCDWSMSARNPAKFPIDRQDLFKEFRSVVQLARKEGCLFARKFEPVMPPNDTSIGVVGGGEDSIDASRQDADADADAGKKEIENDIQAKK